VIVGFEGLLLFPNLWVSGFPNLTKIGAGVFGFKLGRVRFQIVFFGWDNGHSGFNICGWGDENIFHLCSQNFIVFVSSKFCEGVFFLCGVKCFWL
jgi:hypothetical protein